MSKLTATIPDLHICGMEPNGRVLLRQALLGQSVALKTASTSTQKRRNATPSMAVLDMRSSATLTCGTTRSGQELTVEQLQLGHLADA